MGFQVTHSTNKIYRLLKQKANVVSMSFSRGTPSLCRFTFSSLDLIHAEGSEIID
jgi:hypothetical protein